MNVNPNTLEITATVIFAICPHLYRSQILETPTIIRKVTIKPFSFLGEVGVVLGCGRSFCLRLH